MELCDEILDDFDKDLKKTIQCRKKGNREWRKNEAVHIAFALFLVVFILYIILNFSEIKVMSDRDTVTYAIAENVTHHIDDQEKVTKEVCNDDIAVWDGQWSPWRSEDPLSLDIDYTLTNIDEFEGTYRIRFLFFNGSEYPFDKYNGREYKEFMHEVPASESVVGTQWQDITLKPDEVGTINVQGVMPNSFEEFWLVDDYIPYKIRRCNTTVEYKPVQKSITVPEYKEVSVENVTVQCETVWESVFGSFLRLRKC